MTRARDLPAGVLSETECEELARIAATAPGRTALEVGHYKGLSTCVLLGSLPACSVLWTVDHHNGDTWTPASEVSAFEEAIKPWRGRVLLEVIVADFRDAHQKVPDDIAFVFYDAAHDKHSCADFWSLYGPKLAPSAIVVFDDADWRGMAELRERAARDGFVPIDVRHRRRGTKDKRDPATYTLEVMVRGVACRVSHPIAGVACVA